MNDTRVLAAEPEPVDGEWICMWCGNTYSGTHHICTPKGRCPMSADKPEKRFDIQWCALVDGEPLRSPVTGLPRHFPTEADADLAIIEGSWSVSDD